MLANEQHERRQDDDELLAKQKEDVTASLPEAGVPVLLNRVPVELAVGAVKRAPRGDLREQERHQEQ